MRFVRSFAQPLLFVSSFWKAWRRKNRPSPRACDQSSDQSVSPSIYHAASRAGRGSWRDVLGRGKGRSPNARGTDERARARTEPNPRNCGALLAGSAALCCSSNEDQRRLAELVWAVLVTGPVDPEVWKAVASPPCSASVSLGGRARPLAGTRFALQFIVAVVEFGVGRLIRQTRQGQ